jgi:hypothetical protein
MLRTEFGLQVRLPQVIIFNHLHNTVSRCDAGVTQLSRIGRKFGLRLPENRLAHEAGKRADRTPLQAKRLERCTGTFDPSLSGKNDAAFA